MTKIFYDQNGSTLVSIMILMGFLSIFVFGLITLGNANLTRAASRILSLQAQYAAESGADAALAYLNSGNETYAGETGVTVVENGVRYKAEYTVTVTTPNDSSGQPDANKRIITATGNIFSPSSSGTASHVRKVRILAQRSSNVSSSAVLSRNIVHVGSAVKDIIAKDIFVNNYIQMDKNVNNFIAKSITVADRNPSATNCSISGGKLSKPDPGPPTILKLAYTNCSPLTGGATNFSVSENQTDIEKVQSTFIPWQFAMNPSTVTPTSCGQWTLGSSPRNIPYGTSAFAPADDINSNQTVHYPDSDGGVINSCSTAADKGSIDLVDGDTININQNVHLRASLCSNKPCKPKFNNPTSKTRYVFVEGNINFEQITNSPGSGAIVFVAYGADPASLATVCPEGGAVRLGQQGTSNTDAPKIFLLAINGGMCLDSTKFASDRALGGVSGKNLYISTNSGTPFNLAFDPDFPLQDVPINLTFKATQYQRVF